MITLLTGGNDFETERAIEKLAAGFKGDVTKIYGEDIEIHMLPDMLAGATLFSDKRLVIIRKLSENKSIWAELPTWLLRVSDDVHLVLVEPAPDRRTKTYKDLVKIATVREFNPWTEKDTRLAEKWVSDEFKSAGLSSDARATRFLVDWVGLDQWRLHDAVQKLTVLGEVNPEAIKQYIEPNPSENVFNLLDATLRGNLSRVSEMIAIFQSTQDPYMTFGLLTTQVLQLATLAESSKTSTAVAKELGVHPYGLSKLEPFAKKLGSRYSGKILLAFAATDQKMKSSSIDPWILIESLLADVALIARR